MLGCCAPSPRPRGSGGSSAMVKKIRGITIKNTPPPLVADLGQTRGVFLLNTLSGAHPYVQKHYAFIRIPPPLVVNPGQTRGYS